MKYNSKANMERIFFLVISFMSVSVDTADVNPSIVTAIPISETTTVQGKLCDICNCTDDTIDCSRRQLDHHFETSLWPVTPLELATFEENSIVHLKPLPNVTINKLILQFNKIKEIDDKAFKEIGNLSELDLSHNDLTSLALRPEVFQGYFTAGEWQSLPQMRVLSLAYNKLHTLHQDVFVHIPDLKVLNLSGNPLEVIDHPTIIAISALHHLEELNLAYCELEDLTEHMLHSLKSTLKRLYLNGNRFTTIPAALKDATSLEYLNLNENSFMLLGGPYSFPDLPAMKELSMCSLPHLKEIRAGAFSKLTALEELSLCNNPWLDVIDGDALVNHGINAAIMPPLKKLDISNNALQYLPANLLLGRWDKLEKLVLIDNHWICDCDNQYLIGTLLPTFGKRLMPNDLSGLTCSAPIEHAGKNLTSLSHRKLRCLDRYGARPERDAAILVGVLIGLLFTLPVALTLFILWRRGFFFCGPQTPASFSRAFYKRTSTDDI